jgi:hypothetical protein
VEEGLLYNNETPQTITNGEYLFTIRFYDRPTANNFNIYFNCTWGKNLRELGNEDMGHPYVGVKIRVGNLWYHGQGVWLTTQPNVYGWHVSSDFEYYWEDGLYNVPAGMPIEVLVYDSDSLRTYDEYGQYLMMTNFRLATRDAVFSEQKRTLPDTDDFKISDGYGRGIADIYMAFSAYRENSNSLNDIVSRVNWFTNYRYMLYSRERITLRCKRTSLAQLYTLYLGMLMLFNKLWRVISMNQNPYDDETEIIIQRSLAPAED